jgi:hypothetical protein
MSPAERIKPVALLHPQVRFQDKKFALNTAVAEMSRFNANADKVSTPSLHTMEESSRLATIRTGISRRETDIDCWKQNARNQSI